MNDKSLQNQKAALDEMKKRQAPVRSTLGGNEIVALPNVYAGWLDSELMCEVIQVPQDAEVLDLCTGTGVVAMKAAQLCAKHVVAVDINPEAVKSVELNAKRLRLPQVDAREGSLFEPVKGMKFDVIIINPPYVNHEASDRTESAFWDAGNKVTRRFFDEFRSYLKPSGRAYLAWGDFADMRLLHDLAQSHQVGLELLESKVTPDGNETFLAYELKIPRLANS